MSQHGALARARPQRRTTSGRVEPLRLVPAAGARPGTALFALLCVLLLTSGLIGLLMMNTAMAEGAYRLDALESTSGELADTQEALTQALDAQSAPASLAQRARTAGMVPPESTAYLRLEDAKVLGKTSPAPKTTEFEIVTAPVPTTRRGSTTGGPRTTVTTKGTVTTTTVVSSTSTGGTSRTITTVDAATGKTQTRTVETPTGGSGNASPPTTSTAPAAPPVAD